MKSKIILCFALVLSGNYPKQVVTKESATFEVIDGKILVTQMNSKLAIKRNR